MIHLGWVWYRVRFLLIQLEGSLAGLNEWWDIWVLIVVAEVLRCVSPLP